MTIRNTILILLLCLVFSIVAVDPPKDAASLGLGHPAPEDILGAVAWRPQRSTARPTSSRGRGEELQDAVAGGSIPEAPLTDDFVAPGGPYTPVDLGSPSRGGGGGGFASSWNTPTTVDLGGPPRGGSDSGFAPPPNNPRPVISPSGPAPASVDLPR